MPGKIDSLDTDYIVNEYLSGRSVKNIGGELGISDYPIKRVLKSSGVQIRGKAEQSRVNRERIAPDIVALYTSGALIKDICARFEIADGTVYSILKEHGIATGSRNPSHLTIDDVLPLYESGLSRTEIGRKFDVTGKVIDRILRQSGITPENRRIINISIEDILPLYNSGIGAHGVAQRFGTSASVIQRILRQNGYSSRGRAEQQQARMDHTTPEERKRLARAANEAATGRIKTFSERVLAAQTRERTQKVRKSDYESTLIDMLEKRGLSCRPQTAIGPYNADLTANGVAVEVWGGHWHFHGAHAARTPRRFRYIMDAGWHILVLVVTRTYPLTATVGDHVAGLVQSFSSDPSLIRQYRVIWGASEHSTGGCANDDKIAFEPPFVHFRDAATGQYKTISR